MRKSWFKPLLATAVTVFSFGVASVAQAQAPLKMAYALSQTSHYGAGGDAFAKSLEASSQGKFKVQQFANSALGGEREVIEGLQLGTIDLAILSTGATLNFVPQTGVFDVPFLMRDLAHARKVLDGQIGQAMLAEFSERGLVALAWGEQGFRHLTNSKRPVVSAADAKGLKIRTTENQVHITAFRQIGILPTPMAWPEVATALQQGTIDGQENPLSVFQAAKLQSVGQKHVTLWGYMNDPLIFVVNKDVWASWTPEDREIVRQAAIDAGREEIAIARKGLVEAGKPLVKELEALGVTVTDLNAEQRKAFADATKAVYTKWKPQIGTNLVDMAEKAIAARK